MSRELKQALQTNSMIRLRAEMVTKERQVYAPPDEDPLDTHERILRMWEQYKCKR